MAKQSVLYAFTDYPLTENGDTSLKRVAVLTYDRNKYCIVDYENTKTYVKTGYLFRDRGLKRYLNPISLYLLPTSLNGVAHTRKQAYAYSKNMRSTRVKYEVSTVYYQDGRISDIQSKRLSNLDDALKVMSALVHEGEYTTLYEETRGKYYSCSRPLLEVSSDGFFAHPVRGGTRYAIKRKTLAKHFTK